MILVVTRLNNGAVALTCYIPPDEVTAFIDGLSLPVIRMTCNLRSPMLRFVRGDDGLVRVAIPRTPHPSALPFDIVAASDVATIHGGTTTSQAK